VPAPKDDRSLMAVALGWASIIMTVSLEMVVPGLVGYWIDQRLGTGVLVMLAGFVFGMVLATWHLMRVLSNANRAGDRRGPTGSGGATGSGGPNDS
jgi:hypothetical protein